MAGQAEIQTFVDRVVEQFAPRRVILFGSHARGDATPDSDVDLLIVMSTKKSFLDQAVEIRRRVRHSFPLDLIVKTPEDVSWRLSLSDNFLSTIMTEGATLYESAGG
ncbi:MAG: nucleotidyltransferase domain-containing protein [Planctomycetes bacterium]|nr:nucleotidyltransferase domain-containing protein [Planctomycetota bacterium]MBU4398321.1 nucleotidyltransferase domain-containing protein [Planctomycetota bacterium]MCG2682971.1 nucleotidyltransferase domain-containing protein [Planctomycetales bacterium]